MGYKKQGASCQAIARKIGASVSAVKHKIRRLQQAQNLDRYKHSEEKWAQLEPVITPGIRILETHAGMGGMTQKYKEYGSVTCWDKDKRKISYLASQFNINGRTVDSEHEIYRAVYEHEKYQLVDIDPYGFPSRLLPGAMHLIDDGYLVMTFPVMGVAQMNKITIRHYQHFWGIGLQDKPCYIEKVITRLQDFAFCCGRKMDVIDVQKIYRIFRILLFLKKTGFDELAGLSINRSKTKTIDSAQIEMQYQL